MSPEGTTRRSFIAGAIAAFATMAGCASFGKRPSTTTSPAPESERTPTPDQEQIRGPKNAPYTGLYRDVIDSVVAIRSFNTSGPIGEGTGFVYDGSRVITNHRVVAGATQVFVQYYDGKYETAELLGSDIHSDLAILRISDPPDSAESLAFAGQRVPVGSEVVSVGAPFGSEGVMSVGVISSRPWLPAETNDVMIPGMIRTDAEVTPKAAGGPLLTPDGEVVGILTTLPVRDDHSSFAVSESVADRVIPALVEDETYHHPYLGVDLIDLTPSIASINGLNSTQGVLIVDVDEDSPAETILRGSRRTRREGTVLPVGGDVIRAVQDAETPTEAVFADRLVTETNPGETIVLTINRGGREQSISITPDRRQRNGEFW